MLYIRNLHLLVVCEYIITEANGGHYVLGSGLMMELKYHSVSLGCPAACTQDLSLAHAFWYTH